MLYYLSELESVWSALRVFRYITVRAFGGAGTAFLLTALLAPPVIRQLRRLRVGQFVRKEHVDALERFHAGKEGTPTMGGMLIIAAIVGSVLLWAVPVNRYVWLATATLCYMGGVGMVDDLLKLRRRDAGGLRARGKILLQIVWAAVLTAALLSSAETRSHTARLMVPFLKHPVIEDMGAAGTFLFLALIVVGAANAVNLTDGLDGLAIGCTGSVAISYLVMAYVAGHAGFARYLLVPGVPGSGELAVFCGCMLGASLGFLWHNCHPARVFMGDTGSLALGGSIGAVAIMIKQELVLIIVGGVFVIEAISVILQVTSFKLTGRRPFAMTPIHHHFQLRGWSETQITVRFWIISIIFALLGVLTLKIR